MYIQVDKNNVVAWSDKPFEGVTHEVDIDYNDYTSNPEKYIYDKTNQEIILNPDYEDILRIKEEERISNLFMTRGDMFEALILAFGKDKNDIRLMVENLPDLTEVEKKLYLNRFDEALNFYRSHPAVDLLGTMLGVGKERMDKFFDTKDYKDLLPSY